MKKVFIGLGISLAILFVLVGFNAYDRDEAAVKGMMGKLVSALEKGSVEDMRSTQHAWTKLSPSATMIHRNYGQVIPTIPYPSDHQEIQAFLLGSWMMLPTCEREQIHGEPPLVLSGFLAGCFQTLSAIQGV